MKCVILSVLAIIMAMGAGVVYSAPREKPFVVKTSRNDGDRRSGLAVAVTSTSWATVLSANPIRRYAVMTTTATVLSAVCLSSYTTDTCSSTNTANRLIGGGKMEDWSEAILYGRLFDGSAGTVYIYGMEFYDSKDNSAQP